MKERVLILRGTTYLLLSDLVNEKLSLLSGKLISINVIPSFQIQHPPAIIIVYIPTKGEKMKKQKKSENKIEKVMHEFKEGELHSGSKKGPSVKNPKQAIAIALSEARKSGAKIKKQK